MGRVLAVTGGRHFLGGELLRQLDEDPTVSRIHVLDVAPPRVTTSEKVRHVALDLTHPSVDREIAQLIASERVHTVVHGAFLSMPDRDIERGHELEDIGTMRVIHACTAARPQRLVALSSTMVYGPHPHNPNFLSEDAELRGARFARDKTRADRQLVQYGRDQTHTQVCVLRMAPILGPTVKNLFTRFFARTFAPVIAGRDPLVQFLHERDAATAYKVAVDASATGAFNIVGKGVLPYTTVLAFLGRIPCPLPGLFARPLATFLWNAQVASSWPSLIDFFTYLCVADGSLARKQLGFSARMSIRRTLGDFLGTRPEDGATDSLHAQA